MNFSNQVSHYLYFYVKLLEFEEKEYFDLENFKTFVDFFQNRQNGFRTAVDIPFDNFLENIHDKV